MSQGAALTSVFPAAKQQEKSDKYVRGFFVLHFHLLYLEAVGDEKDRTNCDVYGCERERKIQLGISNEVQSSL